jgi:two-component system LytT family response regulator
MPGLTGIDARALMPADGPAVVFCTAHAEHAVAAFDVGAVDYLLKPIEAGRLARAIERTRSALAGRPATPEAPLPARLAVETRQGVLLLDPADISHASLDETLVTLHTSSGPVLCDLAIGELERRLAPHGLLRVHRHSLLNLAHVLRLEPTDAGGYLARTTRGMAVEVSRSSARELRRRLGLR